MSVCPSPLGFLEIASLLGVKPATVNMWRWKGLLPPADHVSVNGSPAWDLVSVLGWAGETGRVLRSEGAVVLYREVFGCEPPPVVAGGGRRRVGGDGA